MSGFDDIDRMVAKCRAIGEIASTTAKIAAPLVAAAVKETVSGGADPTDGSAWKPKKDGGGKPLANAASAIAVKTLGSVIQLILTGHNVFHHYGARGGALPKRRILPDSGAGIPKKLADILQAAAAKEFKR